MTRSVQIQRRTPRRIVDGVLFLDKPGGMTSNAALQKAKWLLNAAKAGHTGTLDPMATGLLPLTFGEATKFSQMLLDADKTYEATVSLGQETDTGDADGIPIGPFIARTFDEASIARVLSHFVGDISQLPPMYSALKRDGKPLYEYARAGIEVERVPRTISIHSLTLRGFTEQSFDIEVTCSKGTYIRTLAIDIGHALGCGAHLSALRRTGIGRFSVEQAISLSMLEGSASAARDSLLAPVDTLVGHLSAVVLESEQTRLMLNGQSLSGVEAQPGLVRLYDAERFIGLGEVRGMGELSPKRLIATGQPS